MPNYAASNTAIEKANYGDKQSIHPGFALRVEVITTLGFTVTEAVRRLAMSRVALSRVLSGKPVISRELAVRLEKARFSTKQA